MAGGSSKAVVFALVGNSFLTVLKFVAFGFSGSGAMLAEGVHSAADTGNQFLLFLGIRRSDRPADAMFHYGFGGERFLFALLSAVGIFVLGCGVTMYHGVHMLLHPGEISGGWLIWVVLAISLVVDGLVLRTAINEVNAQRGKHSFMEYLRQSSDPTIAAVLLEDGAACFGVLLAMGGIGLSIVTGSPIPDAIATLLIGATMGGIAIWLGYKNRTLILGRAIPEPIQNAVVAYLREQPTIESVHDVKSRIVGAGTFKLKADIDWDGRVIASKLDDWSDEQAERFADAGQRTEALHEYGEKMTEALGDEIDRIEAELKERFPELHHLDLESD